ncbi:MAG: MFS transporter [Bacteroidales bacterium]|nr:MFS transporter [Bacteroidales bacterium]
MGLYNFYRISKASAQKVEDERIGKTYRTLRNRTFWGATAAYSLFYLCRLSMGVVKKPLIDEGFFSAAELGVIASAFYFIYAIGKFINGFVADYCNVRRYMATGLAISSVINLLMGLVGLGGGYSAFPQYSVYLIFVFLWGLNGWVLSMGSPSGIVSLSRWFPQSRRGTYYSIFCSTPYIGEALSMILTGSVVAAFGWEYGFMVSALGGFVGVAIILLTVSDTPQSKGLPSIQEISGEEIKPVDRKPTREIQKFVLRHPAIWIIAVSCAFINLTKYGIMEWGVLYLQGARGYSLESASWIIGFSAIFAIAGTVGAGWLSDVVFKGDRVKPALISGIISLLTLGLFLLVDGNKWVMAAFVSVFSLAVGVLYCIVSGLMAIDIVPRKATGAALGIVGISSYMTIGIQNIVSGLLIDRFATETVTIVDGVSTTVTEYDFVPVAIFWLSAVLVSFLLPVLNWNRLKR